MARITGTNANDFLEGTVDDDVINGFRGLDLIVSGPGDDTIVYQRQGSSFHIVADFDAQYFTVPLTGDQANNGNGTGSSAIGFAAGAIIADGTEIFLTVGFNGLDVDGTVTSGNSSDDITSLHIHRAPAGTSGPVVFGLIAPNSDTNGDLDIDPFANTVSSVWNTGEGNSDPADEVANLLAGNLYLNAHTAAFPTGEIRGQIELLGTANDQIDLRGLNISSFETVQQIAVEGTEDDQVFTELSTMFNGETSNLVLFGIPLSSLSADDFIFAGPGNNFIRGTTEADDLFGGGGNDVLLGDGGGDSFNGGTGKDRAQYNTAGSGIIADLQVSTRNTGDASDDTYFSIEDLFGSAFEDDLRGNAQANTIWGGNGGASDILRGRAGDDDLRGGGGDDLFFGGFGADLLRGQSGTDTASYSDATAAVTADMTDSTNNAGLFAAGDQYDSIENLTGSRFADTLVGNGVNNLIDGGDGNDVLAGQGGDDMLIGGARGDVLRGGEGGDVLDGGAGFDQANYIDATSGVTADLLASSRNTGFAENDTYLSVESIRGSNFSDCLFGDEGNNRLDGLTGNDVLIGRGGDDTINGGAGVDFIRGDAGADILTGGLGADRFRFTAPTEGVDTITDFVTGADQLQFDDSGFTSLTAGSLAAGSFVNGAAALDADDFFIYDGTTLSYDADGNGAGAAIDIATFSNNALLDADDFQIV